MFHFKKPRNKRKCEADVQKQVMQIICVSGAFLKIKIQKSISRSKIWDKKQQKQGEK